jgi:hypothetical protein
MGDVFSLREQLVRAQNLAQAVHRREAMKRELCVMDSDVFVLKLNRLLDRPR